MKKPTEGKHILQQTQDGYTCAVCSWTWKYPPREECPGVRRYGYGQVPENLVSLTELRQRKLKPGGPAVGVYRRARRPYDYLYFYDVNQAQPRRTPTEKQREAIEKMRAALVTKYTCQRCGWQDHSHRKRRRDGITTLKVDGQEGRYCADCRDYLLWVHDRHVIEHNMREWLESEDAPAFLVLDTETTGLPDHEGFQVVEIAAVDKGGNVVFHSLIKPDIPMPQEASLINGLTDADLANAHCFAEIWPQLAELLSNYELWAYNAEFDRDAILASAERFKLEIPNWLRSTKRWHCLMLEFAEYHGEEYSGGYRSQGLSTACYELGVQGNGYHRATGDAMNALGVMRALAARGGNYPAPEGRPASGYGEWE